jgi:hypothetical protein
MWQYVNNPSAKSNLYTQLAMLFNINNIYIVVDVLN